MKKIAAGDQRAFKALFDRHSGKVFGYARRLMGDPAKAEDVSQEVWMKVIKVAQSYQPSSRFVAWIYTIVRNTSFNQLRSQKTMSEEFGDDLVDSNDLETSLERTSVEDMLLREERAHRVREKIDDLPENQRRLLTMWLVEDLSYEDLAREADLSLSAVKALLFRAKRNLEKSLKDDS